MNLEVGTSLSRFYSLYLQCVYSKCSLSSISLLEIYLAPISLSLRAIVELSLSLSSCSVLRALADHTHSLSVSLSVCLNISLKWLLYKKCTALHTCIYLLAFRFALIYCPYSIMDHTPSTHFLPNLILPPFLLPRWIGLTIKSCKLFCLIGQVWPFVDVNKAFFLSLTNSLSLQVPCLHHSWGM